MDGQQVEHNPATVASIQISVEWNQSLSWPRSSISCNEPTPRLSIAKPKPSNASRRFVPVYRMKSEDPEGAQCGRRD
jgi:hypothetical protein